MQETKTLVINEQDFVDVDEFTYLGVRKERSAIYEDYSKQGVRSSS